VVLGSEMRRRKEMESSAKNSESDGKSHTYHSTEDRAKADRDPAKQTQRLRRGQYSSSRLPFLSIRCLVEAGVKTSLGSP